MAFRVLDGNLTEEKIRELNNPGRYADGGGLYLQVSKTSTKSWLFIFDATRFGARSKNGKRADKTRGLGALCDVSLREARELALERRRQLDRGEIPIAKREAARNARKLAAEKAAADPSIASFFETDYYPVHYLPDGKDIDTAGNVLRLWRKHLLPRIGTIRISAFTEARQAADALALLWRAKASGGKPKTAQHARQQLEAFFSYANARGKCTWSINPASWDDNRLLRVLLKPVSSFHEVQSHRWMEPAEMPAFIKRVKAYKPKTDREFGISLPIEILLYIIFTGAVRTSEARLMTWDEFDEVRRLWIVPALRTKAGKKIKEAHRRRPHVVPLNKHAFEIVKKMQTMQADCGLKTKYVFAHLPALPKWEKQTQNRRRKGRRDLAGRHISACGVINFLHKYLKRTDATVAGFRESFSTWAHEKGCYDHRDIESILGHTIATTGRGDDVVPVSRVAMIYDHSKRGAQCRQILDDWGAFLTTPAPLPKGVIDFRERRVAHA
jgi:integrase